MTDSDAGSVLKFQKRENQETRKKQKSLNLSEFVSFKFPTPQPTGTAIIKKKKERRAKNDKFLEPMEEFKQVKKVTVGDDSDAFEQNLEQKKKKFKKQKNGFCRQEELDDFGAPAVLDDEEFEDSPEEVGGEFRGFNGFHRINGFHEIDEVKEELDELKIKVNSVEIHPPILEDIVGTWRLVTSTNVAEYLNGANDFSHQKWLHGDVKFTSEGERHLTWCFVYEGAVHDLHYIELGRFKNGEKWNVEKNVLKTSGDYPTDRFILDGQLYSFHYSPVDMITCKLVYERVNGEEPRTEPVDAAPEAEDIEE